MYKDEEEATDPNQPTSEMVKSSYTFYGGDEGTSNPNALHTQLSEKSGDTVLLGDNTQLSLQQNLFRETDSPERQLMKPVFNSDEGSRAHNLSQYSKSAVSNFCHKLVPKNRSDEPEEEITKVSQVFPHLFNKPQHQRNTINSAFASETMKPPRQSSLEPFDNGHLKTVENEHEVTENLQPYFSDTLYNPNGERPIQV